MNTEELRAGLNQCVRCGRCLAVCPVYKQTGWEGSATRGKIALLQAELAGEADLGGRMKDLLSHCLLCGACAEGCANDVRGDELIQAGRALALKGGGLSKLRRLLVRDLLSRGPIAQGLWKGKDLFLKNVPPESGLHFRFPVPGLDKNRWLPQPAARPFLDETDRHTRSEASGPRVALFVGCVSNYLRPETARAAVRVLEAAGARVVVPPSQVCCGKPAAGAGDMNTAKYLARKNLAAFDASQFDYLTAFCATCSEQIKTYGGLLGDEAGPLSEKVKDLSELLVHILDWRPLSVDVQPNPLRVFYHDPCHLRRKQGIFREPRQLLEALPGVQIAGAEDPPVCCGYGGIFNLWHYSLSKDLFRLRAENILTHQPDLVVTSCSGCWLQFEDRTRAAGDPFSVLPLVELLADRGLAD